MTVIATLQAGPFVQQASDRLVTLAEGVPHDAAANKTVLFVATDAVAVAGYSGAAYVGAIPTDQFIAETICERSFGPDPAAFMMGGMYRPRPIGIVALALMKALESVTWTSGEGLQRPQLMVSGWRWRDHHQRRTDRGTFEWHIHSHGPDAYVIGRAQRPKPRSIHITFIPVGRARKVEVDAYLDALEATPLGDEPLAAAHLADLVRVIADRSAAAGDPTVSRDAMIVTIPPPHRDRQVMVRYVADPAAGPAGMHGSYSPWVIGPTTIVAPAALATGWEVPMLPFRVKLVGPPGGPALRTVKRTSRP